MNKKYNFGFISGLLTFSSILLPMKMATAQQADNLHKYGAIAVSDSTRQYGVSWGASTRKEAANLATDYCKVTDCKYMTLDAENSYGALVQAGDGVWKSSGKTQEEAVGNSLNECKQSSNTPNECQVVLISNTNAVIHHVTENTTTYSNNDDTLLLQQQNDDHYYLEQEKYRQQQQLQQQEQDEYYRQQQQQQEDAYYQQQQQQQEEYNRRLQLEQSNPYTNGTW